MNCFIGKQFVTIAIPWGKIFNKNFCPCKVCAKFRVGMILSPKLLSYSAFSDDDPKS